VILFGPELPAQKWQRRNIWSRARHGLDCKAKAGWRHNFQLARHSVFAHWHFRALVRQARTSELFFPFTVTTRAWQLRNHHQRAPKQQTAAHSLQSARRGDTKRTQASSSFSVPGNIPSLSFGSLAPPLLSLSLSLSLLLGFLQHSEPGP